MDGERSKPAVVRNVFLMPSSLTDIDYRETSEKGAPEEFSPVMENDPNKRSLTTHSHPGTTASTSRANPATPTHRAGSLSPRAKATHTLQTVQETMHAREAAYLVPPQPPLAIVEQEVKEDFGVRNDATTLAVETLIAEFRYQLRSAQGFEDDAALEDLYQRLKAARAGMVRLPQPDSSMY